MIMVANKRSKSQMDSDLALFLNNNTKIFTTWLHTVLEKLQQVTVAAIGIYLFIILRFVDLYFNLRQKERSQKIEKTGIVG